MIIALPSYTPGSTAENIAYLPDAGAVQQFVIDVLNQQFNGEIEAYNDNHPTEEPLPSIALDGVMPDPLNYGDGFANCVLVGLAYTPEYRNAQQIEIHGTLTIAIIDGPLSGTTAVKPMWRRADVLTAILEPYSSGLPMGAGQYGFRGWRKLEVESISALSEQFKDYSGVLISMAFTQSAGDTKPPA